LLDGTPRRSINPGAVFVSVFLVVFASGTFEDEAVNGILSGAVVLAIGVVVDDPVAVVVGAQPVVFGAGVGGVLSVFLVLGDVNPIRSIKPGLLASALDFLGELPELDDDEEEVLRT
jgi:hypothetical protein